MGRTTMNNVIASTIFDQIQIWIIPIAYLVGCGLVGWLIERLAIFWVHQGARRRTGKSERFARRALRGQVTIWGILLGIGLAIQQVDRVYIVDIAANLKIPTDQLLVAIHNVLLALFLISFTLVLARLINGFIVAFAVDGSRSSVSLVSNIITFALFVLGILLTLSVFGVQITPFLTAVGVGGLAAGLALQATLTDLVSGLLLLSSRQIRPGDFLLLEGGTEGYVLDINWRTTSIRELSNNIIIVPNARVTSGIIKNFDLPAQQVAVIIPLVVNYGTDLDLVERVTLEVGRDVMRTVPGGVVDYEPLIRFNNIANFGIGFSVIIRGMTAVDQYLLTHEFIKRVVARYQAEGIALPMPMQTVQVRQLDGAH